MADWCVVDLVTSSGEVRRLAVAHVDPDKARLAWEQHQWHPEDLDAPEGVSKVLRTRKSELYADIPRALVEAGARDVEHQKILEELGLTSAMIVPLIANERLLGAITFVTSESGRHYGQSDLDLAEELARRAAMAVENARLYNEAQEAIGLHRSTEERLALLMEASGTLLGSLRLDDVLPAILDLARRSIAADAYAVWRASSTLDDWRIVASTGLSEEYRATSLDSISGSTPAEKAIVVEDVDQDQALESRHQLYKTEGIRSLLVLPLKIHGSNTGTLVFYFRQPHHFDEAEILVASALANLAASAIGTADLYEEQSRMRIDAQAANRTKDEFLATLSHELRTPLTAMMGWISLLRSGKLDEATTAQAMETIERNTKSQAQLIEDILDVSRIITGKIALDFHPLEIGPIVEAALVSLRPSAMTKGILIESGIDVTGPVSGDPRRLQQVIWNLVSNAIKFTPRGGKIQVGLHRADSSAELTVADTGQGISPEFLPHVFDRFRQADGTSTRQHGGLGLGLSIVRHLVELHGGTVQVESAGEGQGATFRVRLPLAIHASRTNQSLLAASDSNGSQEAPMSTPLLSTRLRGKRILIVDDEPDSRILITSTLKLHSAETRDASSAAQALSILDGWHPDLIITDIGMPGEDGYDLIRKVRERSADQGGVIPAVALTAYVSPGDSAHASAAGFQMYIAKPVGPDELTAAIVELTKEPDSAAEDG
jgi:signal transduction histidine kinase/ActR/RegA family two-component response regulator